MIRTFLQFRTHLSFLRLHTQDRTCVCWVGPYTQEALHIFSVYRACSTAVNPNWILKPTFFRNLKKRGGKKQISSADSTVFQQSYHAGKLKKINELEIGNFWLFWSNFWFQIQLRVLITACQICLQVNPSFPPDFMQVIDNWKLIILFSSDKMHWDKFKALVF